MQNPFVRLEFTQEQGKKEEKTIQFSQKTTHQEFPKEEIAKIFCFLTDSIFLIDPQNDLIQEFQGKFTLKAGIVYQIQGIIDPALFIPKTSSSFFPKPSAPPMYPPLDSYLEEALHSEWETVYECIICGDEFPIHDFYILDECDHRFCFGCIKQHVKTQLSSNNASVVCPSLDCKRPISLREIGQLDKELANKFDKMKFEELKNTGAGFTRCPKCPDGCIVNDFKERMQIECPINSCRHSFCSWCKEPYHFRSLCQEVKDCTLLQLDRGKQKGRLNLALQKEVQEKEATKQLIQNTTVPCPKCKIPTEKNLGCDHMTCSICKGEYCWKCLNPFERTKQRGLTHIGPCDPSKKDQNARRLWEEWQSLQKEVEKPIHDPYAKCDACKGPNPLSGTYYECLHCPSFNICALCEDKGVNHQPTHIFRPRNS